MLTFGFLYNYKADKPTAEQSVFSDDIFGTVAIYGTILASLGIGGWLLLGDNKTGKINNEKLEELKKNIEQRNQQAIDSDKKVQELSNILNTKNQELNKITNIIKDKQQEIEKLTKEQIENKNTISKLEQNSQNISNKQQEELKQKTKELSELKNQYDAQLNNLKTQNEQNLKEIQEKYGNLLSKHEEMKKNYEKQNNNINILNINNENLLKEKDNFIKQTNNFNEKIDKLVNDNRKLQEENNKLQGLNTNNDSFKKQYEITINENKNTIKANENKINEMKIAIETMSKLNENNEKKIIQNNNTIAQLKQQLLELEKYKDVSTIKINIENLKNLSYNFKQFKCNEAQQNINKSKEGEEIQTIKILLGTPTKAQTYGDLFANQNTKQQQIIMNIIISNLRFTEETQQNFMSIDKENNKKIGIRNIPKKNDTTQYTKNYPKSIDLPESEKQIDKKDDQIRELHSKILEKILFELVSGTNGIISDNKDRISKAFNDIINMTASTNVKLIQDLYDEYKSSYDIGQTLNKIDVFNYQEVLKAIINAKPKTTTPENLKTSVLNILKPSKTKQYEYSLSLDEIIKYSSTNKDNNNK
jgi:hypothetical protein